MESSQKININLDYSPYNIKNCSFGNFINNSEIELLITGENKSKTKSFLHHFTHNLYSQNKKEQTFLFQTWNYTPSKTINYIIPINFQGQNANNNKYSQSEGTFLFSSQAELLLFNNNEYEQYLIDDELYTKPILENNLIYGLVSNIGLKIFDVNKKETKSILYPGKKHVINDFLSSYDNKNIIFVCEDRRIYLYDKTDEKSFISRCHKMEINLICEGSADGKKFYAYSEEEKSLYLYDIRNINQYIDIIKDDVEITKMIYNKLYDKLFFTEFCSQGITSLDNLKQESVYEVNNDIKNFEFNSDFKLMNIITEDNNVNIINVN